jgi:hypothetical protein
MIPVYISLFLIINVSDFNELYKILKLLTGEIPCLLIIFPHMFVYC